MNKIEFKTEILNNFKDVPSSFFDQIEIYKNILIDQSKLINLTKFTEENKIYGDYFYESIIPYKHIDFQKYTSLLDIGSGSGIPGIVLKLLFPHIKLVIIESNNKKINFMKILVDKLELKNVSLLCKRAEDINNNEYESFDIVTSRAVAPLKIIMEISTPYCRVNGLIIQPKSKNYLEEMNEFKRLLPSFNIELLNVEQFISATNHEHNVLIYKKNKITNRKFPRKWSTIIKENNG